MEVCHVKNAKKKQLKDAKVAKLFGIVQEIAR